MAHYTRTFSTTCPADLIDAINADGSVPPNLLQVINLGNGDVTFDFASALTAGEETALDAILSGWSCPGDPMPTTDDIVSIDDASTSTTNLWTSQQVVDYVASQLAAATTSNDGRVIEANFVYHSTAKNRWIPLVGTNTNLSSDQVPFVCPFDLELVAMTFTNQRRNVDTDIEIWRAPHNTDQESNKTKLLTWALRDVRTGIYTDFAGSPPAFTKGDKVAIYMKDQGYDPKGVVIKMTFKVTNPAIGNLTDNITGTFAGDDDDD